MSVTSNVPSTAFTATAHFSTKSMVQTGTTDAAGAGTVAFRIGNTTPGFKVVVDVDISGRATCSTSFTPQ